MGYKSHEYRGLPRGAFSSFVIFSLGWVVWFTHPSVSAAQEIPSGSLETGSLELFRYQVQEHDTCAGISRRFFGNSRRYDLIHAYNPNMGPPPHTLVPGTVLMLPRNAAQGVSRAPAATVTGVERRVRARPRDEEEWQRAAVGLGLFRYGRVETEPRSSAQLTFADTSVVTVREDTLVIIYSAELARARSTTSSAELERGSLRTRLGDLRMTVNTPSAEVALNGGRTVVSNTAPGSAVQGTLISNHQGTAARVSARRVAGARGRSRSVQVPVGMGTRVQNGAQPETPTALPQMPSWSSLPIPAIGFRDLGATLSARFTEVLGASQYRIEISRDPEGSEVVFAAQVPATVHAFEAHGMPEGVYYATVASIDSIGLESAPSTPTRFVTRTISRVPARDSNAAEDMSEGDRRAALLLPLGAELELHGLRCEIEGQPVEEHLQILDAGTKALHCRDERAEFSEVEYALSLSVAPLQFANESIRVETREEAVVDLNIRSDAMPSSEWLNRNLRFRDILAGTDVPIENGVVRLAGCPEGFDQNASAAGQILGPNDAILQSLEIQRNCATPPSAEEEAIALAEPRFEPATLQSAYSGDLSSMNDGLHEVDRQGHAIGFRVTHLSPVGNASDPASVPVDSQTQAYVDLRLDVPTVPLRFRFGHSFDFSSDTVTTTSPSLYPYRRGSGDVLLGLEAIALKRTRALPLGLSLDAVALVPAGEGIHHHNDVRVRGAVEAAWQIDRVTLRTRQGVLWGPADTAAWLSSYGMDIEVLYEWNVALFGQVAIGRDEGISVNAAALGAAMTFDLSLFRIDFAARIPTHVGASYVFGGPSFTGTVYFETD